MEAFLKNLRARYGDVSIAKIIGQKRNYLPESPFESPPEKISPPVKRNVFPTIDFRPPHMTKPINFPQPTSFKISPVNIATREDWIKIRAEVLDLHELKNFFAGKSDSQSPHFMNMLDKYLKELSRVLELPPEIDEESSLNFVEKLARAIQKRFYEILKSYQRGILGKGVMSADYYRNLEKRVNQYFERIGLKISKVRRYDNHRDIEEHMEILTTKTAPNKFFDGKIDEILIQPHYFEYHDESGEIQKFWVPGQCIVFKA